MGSFVKTQRPTVYRIAALCMVTALSGCTLPKRKKPSPEPAPPPVVTARHTATPVKVDGALDDAAWTAATVYQMSLSKDKIEREKALKEGGEVRLSWDDKNFYVAVKFTDSDIVAEGEEDQLHHYKFGDLVEVFLKPVRSTWYWELYATPGNKKTSFWFPGRGRVGLDSGWNYKCGLRVASKSEGSLNNWEDRDSHWVAEMAMPLKDLTARGDVFAPGAKWQILVARYNYSRYLSWKEYSMVPSLPRTNYHLHEGYAVLELVK